MLKRCVRRCAVVIGFVALSLAVGGRVAAEAPLSLVVMDPLAAPLSCPCVEGYAQRDYTKLAAFLEQRLGRKVMVTFSESLVEAVKKEGCPGAHLVIGKDSVVRADAARLKHGVEPVGRLTGKEGAATQTGLIVVRSADPAQEVADLAGYRILFGPPECDEKYGAARELLKGAGVDPPADGQAETSAACSDGACKIIEWGDAEQAAAVISSYAAPLLEGCGTIEAGDLRVVGETAEVPFVTAFVTDQLPEADRAALRASLLDVAGDPELLKALESLLGFLEPDEEYLDRWPSTINNKPPTNEPTKKEAAKNEAAKNEAAKNEAANAEIAEPVSIVADRDWSGFLGPRRSGHADWLPAELPAEPKIVWRQPLFHAGLGGIAATRDVVILGDRDIDDELDLWRCYDAATGEERWSFGCPASGKLDYGNTPRTTPLVDDGLAYLFGAFGDLACVDVESGLAVWQKNLRSEYAAQSELVWGCCSSPLLVDGNLIVNPGAANAAWVALDPLTGEEVWTAPGDRHAYASPIVAELGGVRQIVAYDRTTLGGWDPAEGRRLWSLTPPTPGDFNVPTPLVIDGKLLIVTENNGARLHAFDDAGRIVPEPVAHQRRLAPDMSTPVVVGDRVYCVWSKMYCLDAADLSLRWVKRERALDSYGAVLAAGDRLLVVGRGGELLLIDSSAKSFKVVSRFKLTASGSAAQQFSQPALVGTRLFVRTADELLCVDLSGDA